MIRIIVDSTHSDDESTRLFFFTARSKDPDWGSFLFIGVNGDDREPPPLQRAVDLFLFGAILSKSDTLGN